MLVHIGQRIYCRRFRRDGAADLFAAKVAQALSVEQDISPGYNFSSVPFERTEIDDAGTLAQTIPSCTAVRRWDAASQTWVGHPLGGPNNFIVEAYLISVTADGTWP